MRKKNNKLLAKTRRMIVIPYDLYHQTSRVFAIGMSLILLAMAIPVAVHIHCEVAHLRASPLEIKAHLPGSPSKTVA